ncbi:hypothetical protein [Azotosporobacter soli]|uniref:hypothetical protein n=1 Tax=Azotosporobacter soli TaxID=3055040 RepID=UPI0031FE7B9C
MEDKLSAKQGMIIGSIVTPIGLHLKYPWNAAVGFIAGIVLLLIMMRDGKTYNRYNFIGTFIMIAACVFGGTVIMENPTDGISGLMEIQVVIVMMFIGIFVIGVGNHIKDPKRVTKKDLAYIFGAFCFIVIYFGAVVWFAYSLHH